MNKSLAEILIERGLTQTAFAEAMGVHLGVVNNWTRGTRPHPSNVPKIAAVLGLTPQEVREMLEETKRRAEAKAESATK